MKADSQDYSLYHRFIAKYLPSGFTGIDRKDPFMKQMEAITETNNQFFYIADIIKMKVIFTSKHSLEMIGVKPEEVTPYHFMDITHPGDLQRLNLGRTKIIKMAQDLYIEQNGDTVLSTNYHMRNPKGDYSNILVQCYIFYTITPYRTVFFLKVHTNIDRFKKIRHGFHYFNGSDLSYFRYPDDELLRLGNVFSDREFEIIRFIEAGMNSEEISEKLFLSVHTVNTHRRNILQKTGKPTMAELIYDLMERGVL